MSCLLRPNTTPRVLASWMPSIWRSARTSVSYLRCFSVFPLFLVILAIVQALLRDSTAARDVLLDALARVTGGFRDEFVATLDAVQGAQTQTGVVGVVLLVMGASWVFGELVSAFNIIWGVESAAGSSLRAWARSTFFSFALVLASAFLLLVSMVISALLAAVGAWVATTTGGGLIWSVAQLALNLVVLTLIFAVLLKSLPQTSVAWDDVWLGALLTALAWSALQGAIGLVIAWSNYGNYGTIGGRFWRSSHGSTARHKSSSLVPSSAWSSRRTMVADAMHSLRPKHTPEPTAHALPQGRMGSSM